MGQKTLDIQDLSLVLADMGHEAVDGVELPVQIFLLAGCKVAALSFQPPALRGETAAFVQHLMKAQTFALFFADHQHPLNSFSRPGPARDRGRAP